MKRGGRIKFLARGASKYTPPPPSPGKCPVARNGGRGGGAYIISPWKFRYQVSRNYVAFVRQYGCRSGSAERPYALASKCEHLPFHFPPLLSLPEREKVPFFSRRKAPEAFPDSNTTLDTFQSAMKPLFFTARQADSPESLEFLIRANHATKVAHVCGDPLSRYTCRATRVTADLLKILGFFRCSSGIALHPPQKRPCRTCRP